MKDGYKKLLELLRQHGYSIEKSGYDDKLFIITISLLYFTGSDFYSISKYAEESGIYFDGFMVEPTEDGLSVALQFLDSKPEEAI